MIDVVCLFLYMERRGPDRLGDLPVATGTDEWQSQGSGLGSQIQCSHSAKLLFQGVGDQGWRSPFAKPAVLISQYVQSGSTLVHSTVLLTSVSI